MDDDTLEQGVPGPESPCNGVCPEEKHRKEVKLGGEAGNVNDQHLLTQKEGHQTVEKAEEVTVLGRKKGVPVWRLFQYANCLDVMMIIVGTVMALAAGLALPGHILLIGRVLNQFINHNITSQYFLTLSSSIVAANVSCESYRAGLSSLDLSLLVNTTRGQGSMTSDNYFCQNDGTSGNGIITSSRLEFLCDPDATLRRNIGLFSLYYVALASGLLAAMFVSTLFWNLSALHQIQKMRKALYYSILRQDIGWFDAVDTGDINNRIATDIEKIQTGIGDKVAIFIQNLATFVASIVIGFTTYWKLTLIVNIAVPILTGMVVILTKAVALLTRREQEAYSSAGGIAEEVLSSIRTVVAFGGEKNETERYGEKLKLTRNEGLKKHLISNLVLGSLYLVLFFTYGMTLWYGSVLLVNCDVSPGDIFTILLSVVGGSFALGNALPIIEAFATALGSATAVFEIIDRKPVIDSTSNEGEIPDHLNGNIEFNDVVFAYPTRPDVQILNGVDLKIKSGDTVALVGPSGCGKSTILQLIQRFYNPLGGLDQLFNLAQRRRAAPLKTGPCERGYPTTYNITIDGRDISTYNLQWLRRHIGIVSQEPVLFHSTIAENIRYGREDATMEDIIEATKNANAHGFISQMPDGYDTPVGQRGAQLSGGQKQRIAIARAIVRNPKILILDEATSALDNQSERVVQKALDKAREGRTTIVIAHRLSTIKNADVIVAISEGRVAEFGSHDDLMSKKGLYYELVTAQTIEEEKQKELSQPLARFKAAVNKSIEARRQLLAKFRAAVKDSMTASKRRVSQRGSLRKRELSRKPPVSRQLSRQLTRQLSRTSSRLSMTLASADAFSGSTHRTHLDDIEDFEEEVEVAVEEGKKKNRESSNFMELLKLNKPDWIFVLVGVIFSVLIGCLFPVIAILVSQVLKIYGLTDRDVIQREITKVLGGFIGIAICAFFFHFISNFSLSVAGERLTKRLRYLSFKSMLNQEIAWFDKKTNSTGALLTRLASDASAVKGATGIFIGRVLQIICTLAAGLTIAFVSSWELALVMAVAFPVHAIANYIQIRLLSARVQENKRGMEECGQTALESIDNIRTVAGLSLEPHFISKYSSLLKGPLRSNVKSVLVQALMLGVGQCLLFFIYSASFSLGAFLVTEDRVAYDEVFRVLSVIYFSASSTAQLSGIGPELSRAKVSATRILSLLKRKPQIDASEDGGLKLDEVEGNISAKSVHFSYPSRSKVQVLQGLTIDVKPSQTLALVGPSGCGKSTLVSLVERFYDPRAGRVSLEGKDLKDLNLSWLRRQIALVPQEPTLFDISIADNIRYGALHRAVSDEEVVEAAMSANIHKFIESLPLGYATNVGSKGTQLSGGQKQRIAIARALVRNPKILLLDEATSALDTESEKIVQEALDKARQGRTSIVIAHRLSTIYNSDVIAVIHEGQVIESGTHGELMGMKEAYYHLNTVQQNE